MLFISIMHHYLFWHYGRAFKEIFHVWLNFLWFTVQLFSIPQLMRSWFDPWKRVVTGRGNKWNLEDLAGFIIIGFLSRAIGFLLRTTVITLGVISLLIVAICGFIAYAFWLVAPAVIIGLLGSGITLIVA